jgi:hypothetical protein
MYLQFIVELFGDYLHLVEYSVYEQFAVASVERIETPGGERRIGPTAATSTTAATTATTGHSITLAIGTRNIHDIHTIYTHNTRTRLYIFE